MRRLVLSLVIASALLAAAAAPGLAAPVPVHGHDNISTALAWSQLRFADGTAPVAVLARDDNFADALAAGAVAGFQRAPFLVTKTASLDAGVAAELERVGADLVAIIGGTGAVSTAVENELETAGYTTQRFAGTNRIATATAVAEGFRNPAGQLVYESPSHVYLARAFGAGTAGFADSLGGGMIAGKDGVPLLLTETERLSDSTRAYLASIEPKPRVTIIGGTAAVSPTVENDLKAMELVVNRIAGVNRFATAQLISQTTFGGGVESVVVLVDGLHNDSWVSGFSAPVFAASSVLLTSGSELPSETGDELERIDGQTGSTDTILYCAPQVGATICNAADAILNT